MHDIREQLEASSDHILTLKPRSSRRLPQPQSAAIQARMVYSLKTRPGTPVSTLAFIHVPMMACRPDGVDLSVG